MPETGSMDIEMPTSAGETATTSVEAAPFQRLLVPVDFSASSRAALALAMRIADRWGSEVVLFHAAGFDENDSFLDHTGVPWGRGDVVGEASEHLRRFADTVEPGSSGRVRIDATRDENAVRAVVRACERHEPSLVVLGTHPRRAPKIFRSRAERIARAVACTVVFVPGEEDVQVDADM
jgi:nucleotide-binding universal stress UspA family protein